MRATLLPLAVLPATGLALASGGTQPDGVVRHTLTPQRGAPLVGKRAKRQLASDSTGKRSGTLYTIDLTLGTPGQAVPVLVDTGGSELWVNPTCSQSGDPAFCATQARFTVSTSLVDFGVQGQVSWDRGLSGAGSASFEYVADYVGIGCKWTPPRACSAGLPDRSAQQPRLRNRSSVPPTPAAAPWSALWVLAPTPRAGRLPTLSC